MSEKFSQISPAGMIEKNLTYLEREAKTIEKPDHDPNPALTPVTQSTNTTGKRNNADSGRTESWGRY
eukprot:3861611-Prymnesium_polylepis.1